MTMTQDNPVFQRIEQEIGSHPVVLFMKGTPIFPQCGFSAMVVQVLGHMGVKFKSVDVLNEPAIRDGIKQFSDWPTSRSFTSRANSSAAATSSAKCTNPANWSKCSPPKASKPPPNRRRRRSLSVGHRQHPRRSRQQQELGHGGGVAGGVHGEGQGDRAGHHARHAEQDTQKQDHRDGLDVVLNMDDRPQQ